MTEGPPGFKPGLDPRLHPARPDLAADWLEGKVEAAAFVAGAEATVAVPQLTVKESPDPKARQATEFLFGEDVLVYERARGWAWVMGQVDGYMGYVREEGLARPFGRPTHEVTALRTPVFPAPDLKRPAPPLLHLTSRVRVLSESGDGKYSEIETAQGSGWVPSVHLTKLGEGLEADIIATARRFLGAPYLWGGRSTLGLDCSALIQLALARAGLSAQRDSDMQSRTMGDPVAGGVDAAEPGDVLYMPGHCVIVTANATSSATPTTTGPGGDGGDPRGVIHANAFHMAVAEEPLSVMVDRFRAMDLEVEQARRPRIS